MAMTKPVLSYSLRGWVVMVARITLCHYSSITPCSWKSTFTFHYFIQPDNAASRPTLAKSFYKKRKLRLRDWQMCQNLPSQLLRE